MADDAAKQHLLDQVRAFRGRTTDARRAPDPPCPARRAATQFEADALSRNPTPPDMSPEDLAALYAQIENLAGDEDLDAVVAGMLDTFLSATLLHAPLHALADGFPAYLESLPADDPDRDRYEQQYALVQEILAIEEDEDKAKVHELMAQFHALGEPPEALVEKVHGDAKLEIDMAAVFPQGDEDEDESEAEGEKAAEE
ncbi:hypothetical protein AMAG_07938 [Allomyces macrogynus ATCC 38327]|uniref:Uncharacterized protein n=1 Tax=Allomyces macrogynus (strain ATCC 38327) TaxID=578462 RepID=A0A0L0SJU8_ALLM3|nr:hypothetical protein AMAG_07938 [Allomyces macrogynus ATCC 38327]|eukprot:KNE62752.1 hypothetical protein AMAG_07938 [Allomyces macrogynus ATCC 38327]